MDMFIGAAIAGVVGLLILWFRERRERDYREWYRQHRALKAACERSVAANAAATERWVEANGPTPEDVERWKTHSVGTWQRGFRSQGHA